MKHRTYVGLQQDYDKMSQWQFDYVTNLPEIKKTSRFLDLGCGSLRLGKKLIPWLNKNKYIGLDCAGDIVDAGLEQECDLSVVAKKNPQFVITDNWVTATIDPVDVIWAQAVFNHLNLPTIEQCVSNIKSLFQPHTVFYFTYWPGEYKPITDDAYSHSKINVHKTLQDLQNIFARYQLQCVQLEDKTVLGQSICKVTHEI